MIWRTPCSAASRSIVGLLPLPLMTQRRVGAGHPRDLELRLAGAVEPSARRLERAHDRERVVGLDRVVALDVRIARLPGRHEPRVVVLDAAQRRYPARRPVGARDLRQVTSVEEQVPVPRLHQLRPVGLPRHAGHGLVHRHLALRVRTANVPGAAGPGNRAGSGPSLPPGCGPTRPASRGRATIPAMRHNALHASHDPDVVRQLIREHPWGTLISFQTMGHSRRRTTRSCSTRRPRGSPLVTHVGRPDEKNHGFGEREMLLIVAGTPRLHLAQLVRARRGCGHRPGTSRSRTATASRRCSTPDETSAC